MKKRMLAVLMASAMMLALVLSSCGDSGDDPAQNSGGSTDGEVYTLRIGTGTGGRDKQVAWMEEYEKALEEATGGRIDVQCYPSGSIGSRAWWTARWMRAASPPPIGPRSSPRPPAPRCPACSPAAASSCGTS